MKAICPNCHSTDVAIYFRTLQCRMCKFIDVLVDESPTKKRFGFIPESWFKK